MGGQDQLRAGRSIAQQVSQRRNNIGVKAKLGFFDAGDRCRCWVEKDREDCQPTESAIGKPISGN